MVPRSPALALEGWHGEVREEKEEKGRGLGKAEDLAFGKSRICCDSSG